MRRQNKIFAIMGIAAAFCVTSGITAFTANAAEETKTSAFTVGTGASIRYSEPTGIRFKVKLGQTEYESLVDTTGEKPVYDEGKTLYATIAPMAIVNDMTFDVNGLAMLNGKGEIKVDVSTIRRGEAEENEDENYYYANVVLGSVLYENLGREFAAIAYTKDGETVSLMDTKPVEGRSVAYVASAALADTSITLNDTQKNLLNEYVQLALAYEDKMAEQTAKENYANGQYLAVTPTLDQMSNTINVGDTFTLVKTLDTDIKLFGSWESDDSSVATVDKNGTVTAVTAGTTTITYSVYGETATCTVTVQDVDNVLPEDPWIGSKYLIDGKMATTVSEVYDGVSYSEYKLDSTSKYGKNDVHVLEFNPKQSDLYFRVDMGGETANGLNTVKDTVTQFNATNNEGLKAIAAINGDLWMTSEHSGSSVTSSVLTIPRGFNMYNGEIITSSQITQENSERFYSFGVTPNGKALLGDPQVAISIQNKTKSLNTTANGLNRLPANDALVMYSDVYSTSNYSLSDAYEIVIDCGYDYTVKQGAVITGKVVAIAKQGDTNYNMQQNRIILTARGSRVAELESYVVGDEISINVSVTDNFGNHSDWQEMENAVGGHIPVVRNGVSTNPSDTSEYTSSLIGRRKDGTVVMMAVNKVWSLSGNKIKVSDYDDLCLELGLYDAFLLDGGGSTEMVNLINGEYVTVNNPSDGSSRKVVNTIIIATKLKED